jgi:hypothetical protein
LTLGSRTPAAIANSAKKIWLAELALSLGREDREDSVKSTTDGIHAVHAGNDFVSNRSDSFRLGQFRETAILVDDICAGESYPIIYV